MNHQHLLKTIALFQVLQATSLFAQVFDEKFEYWPQDLKINGTVLIVNQIKDTDFLRQLTGDEFLSSPQPRDESSPEEPKLKVGTVLTWKGLSPAQCQAILQQWGLAQNTRFFNIGIKADWKLIQSWLSRHPFVLLAPGVNAIPQKVPELDRLKTVLQQHLERKGVLIAAGPSAQLLGQQAVMSDPENGRLRPGLNVVPDSLINLQLNSSEVRFGDCLKPNLALVGIDIHPNSCLVLRGRKLFTHRFGQATLMLPKTATKPRLTQLIGQSLKRSSRKELPTNVIDLTQWRRMALERNLPPFPPKNPVPPRVKNGTLVIVGGGGMPKGLMKRFVDFAGGKEQAKLVFVPCAESDEIQGIPGTVQYWKKMGIRSATFIHTKDRMKANADPQLLSKLEEATGIWFGGGRQWNFSDSYYGTTAHKLMKLVLQRGGVIGGSSAGASIQARYLARATPLENFRIMAPGYERGGLGFISGVAIDQHFTQRSRQKDMKELMQTHPQLLGIGIDEATAIIVRKSRANVVGQGQVYFYDCRQSSGVNPKGIGDAPNVVTLKTGSTFDLMERKVIVDQKSLTPRPDKF
ncbi:MAG: cyanophycinase [Planctomycetota bacterium]|nr:cyanophycinase [Planctomycetota bacterium]